MTNDFASQAQSQRIAGALRMRRLFGRFGAVILTLVALIALIIGGLLLASQRWPAAQATVQSCTSQLVGSGNGTGTSHRHQEYHCVVNWQDSSGVRTATVNFGAKQPRIGEVDTIRVHGNTTVLATPAWAGWVTLAVGVLLGVLGVLWFLRSLRRPSVA